MRIYIVISLNLLILILTFCSTNQIQGNLPESGREAKIFPDYSGITIPPNIAPLNFYIDEEGSDFQVKIFSKTIDTIFCSGKTVDIPLNKWKTLLESNLGNELNLQIYVKNKDNHWTRFKTIINHISSERIDSYLAYRLIHPGYEDWREMGLYQRNLENFNETPIIYNRSIDENCVNCHTFCKNDPGTMMFHVRGNHGGTILLKDKNVKRLNIAGKPLISGGVYPAWNPDGKHIAFSVNKITQLFHAIKEKNIIVMDTLSDLVVYDIEKNTIISDIKLMGNEFMETFPAWSPDGLYLYFCRAPKISDTTKYNEVRYDLMRISFNPQDNTFGWIDTVIQAKNINGSISFPRISPNGKYLMFTLADYGTFPIWHAEADLYLIDLKTNRLIKMEANSSDTDSFHDWSSGGNWFVFSSKRLDGQWGRSFFSYVDKNGKSSKPFILPQKDPHFYETFLRSYNAPQLVISKIEVSQSAFAGIVLSDSTQAIYSGN